MAKQDDRNRDEAISAIDALYDRIKELEVELEQL